MLNRVDAALPDAVGKLRVASRFPAETSVGKRADSLAEPCFPHPLLSWEGCRGHAVCGVRG